MSLINIFLSDKVAYKTGNTVITVKHLHIIKSKASIL